jgi:hypothetical protein
MGDLISASGVGFSILFCSILGFVRAEYFFFFLVRHYSVESVTLRVLEVFGWR